MADFNVEVPMVNSAEELEALLAAQGATEMNEDGSIKDPAQTPPANEDDDKDDLNNVDDKTPKGKGQPTETEGGEEEEEEEDTTGKDENYNNVIAYLDTKHKLGLNLQGLPENLTREDEAELVSDLFEKVVNGANEKLNQFKEVQELLKDEEVVLLLKAKSEGKGLKDLYGTFSASAEGMTNEQIVFDDFKKKYPKLTDTSINSMIATQKEKGQFDEIATAIREQRKEDDVKSTQQRLQEETQRSEREKLARVEEDKVFQGFVQKVGKVNGVVFTEDMKAEALSYALQRDKEGLSQLDRALQSDVGVLRAVLGIIHLEKLMGATASVQVNKKNKKLVDRLFDKPSQANSGGGTNKEANQVPDELYNKF